MINNKKGLSQVVTIVIMVVLVLIAAAIVWGVVNTLIGQSAGQVDIGSKCLSIDVSITNATCTTAGVCSITLKRTATGEAIGGVKIIVSNSTSSNSTDISGNIAPVVTVTKTALDFKINSATKAEVVPYLKDAEGKAQLCTQINEHVVVIL